MCGRAGGRGGGRGGAGRELEAGSSAWQSDRFRNQILADFSNRTFWEPGLEIAGVGVMVQPKRVLASVWLSLGTERASFVGWSPAVEGRTHSCADRLPVARMSASATEGGSPPGAPMPVPRAGRNGHGELVSVESASLPPLPQSRGTQRPAAVTRGDSRLSRMPSRPDVLLGSQRPRAAHVCPSGRCPPRPQASVGVNALMRPV